MGSALRKPRWQSWAAELTGIGTVSAIFKRIAQSVTGFRRTESGTVAIIVAATPGAGSEP